MNNVIRLMDFSTRRKRRAAVKLMVAALEKISTAELNYRDNLPVNLMESELYDKAEEFIGRLEEVIELLSEVYDWS